jgi:hypothetical protein
MNTDWNDDPFLDVCQNIEVGLRLEYDKNEKLTDAQVVNALENARVAVRQRFGYSKNEKVGDDPEIQGILDRCVKIAESRIGEDQSMTLKDFSRVLEKIKRSVRRHSEDGRRGYYEFIKDFV